MNNKGFWKDLDKPIVGLSPMDGVTDAPMRFIAKKYGKVDITYTEFVSAEGLWRIKKRGEMENKIWQDLRFDKAQGPNIVQLFGSDPESFYESAKIVCELGFDGIDINMGCPSPGLEKRGGGAGLIRDKCNAKEVVEATRRGVIDFFDSEYAKNPCSHETVSSRQERDSLRLPGTGSARFVSLTPASSKIKLTIPVSVKTRIGSDRPDLEWWKTLAELKLPAVAMHGRTFKQLYSGEADWEVLLKAAEIIRESGALFLGNGDIQDINFFDSKFAESSTHAYLSRGARMDMLRAVSARTSASAEIDASCTDIQKFVVDLKGGRSLDLTGRMDGVLLGRGAIGNPWALRRGSLEHGDTVTREERLKVAVEHAFKFEEMLPEQKFFVMRKHLVGYCSGFPEATELRKALVQTNSALEVELVVKRYLASI